MAESLTLRVDPLCESHDGCSRFQAIDSRDSYCVYRTYTKLFDHHYLLMIDSSRILPANPFGIEDIKDGKFPPEESERARIEKRLISEIRKYARNYAQQNNLTFIDELSTAD